MQTYLFLFIAAFLAAAISGAAGFGGALLLLPLLTLAQLIGNISRAAFGLRQIRWRPVGLFLLGAVPCSIAGAMSFVALPAGIVTRLIGLAILAFVILRAMGILRATLSPRGLILGGGVVGGLSGLVGSAGPLSAAMFLTLNLPAGAYIASEASTAIVMHIVKSIIYQRSIHLDRGVWFQGAVLGGAMILGTVVGKHVIERLPVEQFRRFVMVLLGVVALRMLFLG